MARTSTTNYKHYAKAPRQMTTDEGFELGMMYSDAPLAPGYVKTLLNMDITEQGMKLKPRAGIKQRSTLELLAAVSESDFPNWHTYSSGAIYVKVGDDAIMTRYQLIGLEADGMMDAASVKLVLENPDTQALQLSTLSVAPATGFGLKLSQMPSTYQMHGFEVTNPNYPGMAAVVDNTLYLLYKEGTSVGMCKMEVEYATGAYTHKYTKVSGKEITPTEAVNYGYNMLDDDPYTFDNTAGSILKLQGILPYKDGTLKLSARVGEKIDFRLVYEYNTAETRKLKVQWEFNDLTTDKAPNIVQAVASSPTYTCGDAIILSSEPPYKAFSLTAKVYYADDTATPVSTMILASYHITKDKPKDEDKTLKVVSYDLGTADGICTWASRAVVWGVDGARSTAFISDVKDPSYFPFPQMSIQTDENIIRCVPYLSDMLIFTETKLIHATILGTDITSKVIQENLNMRQWDADTIVPVKNMMWFKSNNYYYMMVPVINIKGGSDLKMAPVSKPIESLLDNFLAGVKEILTEAYDVEFPGISPSGDWTVEMDRFYNWLDNTTIYNTFVLKCASAKSGINTWVEFSLKYDALLRSWSAEALEVPQHGRTVYRQIVTNTAIYSTLYRPTNGKLMLETLQPDALNARDDFALSGSRTRYFKNCQFLDTGKRNHAVTHKKRYREIQFSINNISKEDIELRDAFILDDDPRKDLFEYTVQHITDKGDPDYGTIYIDRTPTENMYIPGVTKLGSWKLGISALPDVSYVPVRVTVSGKGYTGRYKLLGLSEAMYELLRISWVYRLMNAR